MKTAIVIPALNEAPNVPLVLGAIPPGLRARVVLCDNGSTDGTPRIAEELGATVVQAPRRGYGTACLAGIDWLAQHDPPDALVILDSDHADDPGLLPDLLGRIERDEADLVLSTRTRGGAEPGSMTPLQIWGNRLQTAAINARFGLQLTDMGPMRAIRWTSLQALGMADPTWGWNVEMACKAARAGLRIVEVPVAYRNRAFGESKISGSLKGAARAGARILGALWTHAR